MLQHPVFVQAVNRAANLKCLEAIKSGKLRVVPPPNLPATARYTPRMDLIDDPSSSKLAAVFEIPGIKTNDISLHIRDGQLVVKGERKSQHSYLTTAVQNPISATAVASEDMETDSPARNVRALVQELRFGQFHRSIRVPDGIKESDVKASLEDGMLLVTWPRSPVVTEPSATIISGGRATNNPSPPTFTVTAGTASQ
jgi:HSP20 family molecular chaperone IbpA